MSKHLITGAIWAAIIYGFGFFAFGVFELINASENTTLSVILVSALRAALIWPMTLVEAYSGPL